MEGHMEIARPAAGGGLHHRRTFHLNRAQINLLLFGLVVLDAVLSATAIVFPQRWTEAFHHLPYEDPAGLLRRAGAVWLAFLVLQVIALARWQDQPYWLTIIAGVRLTELFSDWATLLAAQQVTTVGVAALAISPVSNLAFGWVLIATYKRLQAGPLPDGSWFANPWS
jgi:hypothetical protein